MAQLPSLTMVLGGAASGKSAFAEHLMRGTNHIARTYIATAQAHDDEMRRKISRHQKQRAADGWLTIEEPLEVATLLAQMPPNQPILLDCATLWLSNQMMAKSDLHDTCATLLKALTSCPAPIVVVTNEVGQGIVPEHAISRQFREAQGALNQMIAAKAPLVVQVIAGLPMVLKGQLPQTQNQGQS